jgi:hypothetical protein
VGRGKWGLITEMLAPLITAQGWGGYFDGVVRSVAEEKLSSTVLRGATEGGVSIDSDSRRERQHQGRYHRLLYLDGKRRLARPREDCSSNWAPDCSSGVLKPENCQRACVG